MRCCRQFFTLLLIGLFYSACAQTSRSTQTPEQAFVAGDSQGILNSYNAAIAEDPNNLELRAARCTFLGELAERGRDKTEWQDLRARALADCDHVLKTAKDGRRIANTLDMVRLIDWRMTYIPKEYPCPDEARKAAAAAYNLFRAHKLNEALPQYKLAVDRCPEDASLWIEYGHTFMLAGDLKQAEFYMSEGVKRERWQRSGNLFLSDLYRVQGQLDLAYKHAALAIVSDPTYEFGWEQLKELAKARGREWRRVVNRRAVVAADTDKNPQISFPLGTEIGAPETSFWLGLGLVEASEVKPGVKPRVFLGIGHDVAGTLRQLRQRGTLYPNELDYDRNRVKKNLDFQRDLIAKDPKDRSVLIDVVEEALQKGYLDEAIFLSLIDWRLLPEYVDYREQHADRLLDYIALILAPPQRF